MRGDPAGGRPLLGRQEATDPAWSASSPSAVSPVLRGGTGGERPSGSSGGERPHRSSSGGTRAASSAASGKSPFGSVGGLLDVDEHSSKASSKMPLASSRDSVGSARLEARDQWNTSEHEVHEIFMKYDRDRSGALEMGEFRSLLQDFNGGHAPSDQEYAFMMRVADKDHDGVISLGELHYAIRAWHSYCNLDDSVLRLFAEFDVDHSGRLDPGELRELLTTINGGVPVPWAEVQQVMVQSDVLGTGAISRSELLGAIAAWYARVDRKKTDIPTLLREAMARTVKDNDGLDVLSGGTQTLKHAKSIVSGTVEGYSDVNAASPDRPGSMDEVDRGIGFLGGHGGYVMPGMGAPLGSTGGVQKGLADRLKKASPYLFRSCQAFCYIAFPFLTAAFMVFVGYSARENECPRNLDGVLVWFGLLGISLSASAYIDREEYNAILGRVRMALVVILAMLNVVGFLWARDEEVLKNKWICGNFLVFFSNCVWFVIPVVSLGYGAYCVAAHFRRLQKQDQAIQHDVSGIIVT